VIDGKTAKNTHKSNLYPPLRKGRLGGDDGTKRLSTACLKMANCLLCGHPFLRLPFPRGGYQLAFLLIVPYSSLPTNNLQAAKKLLCYSVFKKELLCLYTATAAEKLRCYAAFKNYQQPFLPLERGG
jgi:hypothetical protein